MSKTAERLRAAEFGDFQTPSTLAAAICRLLAERGMSPATVVEPTCGIGSLLLAALKEFPTATGRGMDINPEYIASLTTSLAALDVDARCRVSAKSFFDVDWKATFQELPEPVLVLGNPPWVTNSQLGVFGSSNLPAKSNEQGLVGLDALTGKSNFDISEWMLVRLIEALAESGRRGWVAVLCKTAVARRVLTHCWTSGRRVSSAEMRVIDARASFNAAVDACLLICEVSPLDCSEECMVYPQLAAEHSSGVIGWREGQLIADVVAYERWKHLQGAGPYQWRSGVKHDCSKVMELTKEADGYRNGLGERVELEDEFVYPMYKSSDIASGRIETPARWMLLPQRKVGDETAEIASRAPRTWRYLLDHADALDRRASSIYRNRPRFSVFGVGDYTFSPWKVAISGFYKRLVFSAVGGFDGKPTVFDDTVYFIPCTSEDEAHDAAAILNSKVASEFFSAFLFWDAKRPITVDLLRRLDLTTLATELTAERALASMSRMFPPKARNRQLDLFAS